ncbi:hypothetical protein [Aquimarina mytili]|uniref:Uncharacterized protein n=1 Tax=Aquimarina mytili TaxID=874423 RepID=A0A936ZVE9_9FLAO|nr:hypothetical protein [Aquimarina mytili]MBL0686102.1 hypothetical protein [Aquimarina mytili]
MNISVDKEQDIYININELAQAIVHKIITDEYGEKHFPNGIYKQNKPGEYSEEVIVFFAQRYFDYRKLIELAEVPLPVEEPPQEKKTSKPKSWSTKVRGFLKRFFSY